MEKDKLLHLIKQKFSTRQISLETGKSQTTVRYWLKQYGLKTEIKKFNKVNKINKVENKHLCNSCGETRPENFYKARMRCKNCHNKAQIEFVKLQKQKAVAYKGGKCSKCGYCKNYSALDFHHLDPSQKDPNWKTSRNWKWERLQKELDKCILVCRNCHSEIHHPHCAFDSENQQQSQGTEIRTRNFQRPRLAE